MEVLEPPKVDVELCAPCPELCSAAPLGFAIVLLAPIGDEGIEVEEEGGMIVTTGTVVEEEGAAVVEGEPKLLDVALGDVMAKLEGELAEGLTIMASSVIESSIAPFGYAMLYPAKERLIASV